MDKLIVISIKPDYMNKILAGSKKIELRKSSPKVNANDVLVLYSTNPVKAIVGFCKVKYIIKTTPDEMWNLYSRDLGIEQTDFNNYYAESNNAIGIVLEEATRLKKEIPLSIVKRLFPNFSPPQTFKYFSLDAVQEKAIFSDVVLP